MRVEGIFYIVLISLLLLQCKKKNTLKKKLSINCERIILFHNEELDYGMLHIIVNFKNNTGDTIVFLNKNNNDATDFLGRKSNFIIQNEFIRDTMRTAFDIDFKIEPFMVFKQIYFLQVSKKSSEIINKSNVLYVNNWNSNFKEGSRLFVYKDTIVIKLKDIPIEHIYKELDFHKSMEIIGARKVN